MAYCKYCGKKLSDSEICDCEESKVELNETDAASDNNEVSEIKIDLSKINFEFNINEFVTFIFNYFKHPISTVENHIKSRDYTSILLQSILLIVFNFLAQSSLAIKYKSFSLLLILFSLIIAALYVFIPGTLAFICNKIQKQKCNYIKEIAKVILHTPVFIISLVLVTLSGFIGIKEYIIMGIISVFVYVFSMISLSDIKEEYKNNMIFRIMVFALIIIALALFILAFGMEGKAVLSDMIEEVFYDIIDFI